MCHEKSQINATESGDFQPSLFNMLRRLVDTLYFESYKLIRKSASTASEEMANMRNIPKNFRVMRNCGMGHIMLLGMYFTLRMRSVRFIAELDRLFGVVEEMKGFLIESGDDAENSCSSGSN